MPAGKTEIFFHMIDVSFNNSPYFVSTVPFFGIPDGAGICTEVFFWIDVNHAAAFRGSAGGSTQALPVIFPSGFIVYPFELRTDELVSVHTTAEFGNPLIFHGMRWSMRTAGDAILIDCIVHIFEMSPCIKWYVCFRKMASIAKGITRKKILIKLQGIKSSITKKDFRKDYNFYRSPWILHKLLTV